MGSQFSPPTLSVATMSVQPSERMVSSPKDDYKMPRRKPHENYNWKVLTSMHCTVCLLVLAALAASFSEGFPWVTGSSQLVQYPSSWYCEREQLWASPWYLWGLPSALQGRLQHQITTKEQAEKGCGPCQYLEVQKDLHPVLLIWSHSILAKKGRCKM